MNQLTAVTEPATEQATLDDLCEILMAKKASLAIQQRNVRKAEDALIAAVGSKDEGSFSVNCDRFKVTTTQPVTRKVSDASLVKDLLHTMPRDIYDALFDWRPTLSVKTYKDLERYQPELFETISRAVISKPGKISVKIEELS